MNNIRQLLLLQVITLIVNILSLLVREVPIAALLFLNKTRKEKNMVSGLNIDAKQLMPDFSPDSQSDLERLEDFSRAFNRNFNYNRLLTTFPKTCKICLDCGKNKKRFKL